MNKSWLPLLVCAFTWLGAEELALPQALREALDHNPGYQASRNDVRYYDAAVDSALAGYLPTVTATGAVTRSWLDTHQERTGGVIQNQNGAQTTLRTAGVNMDWTLFQGFSAPLNRRRLKLQRDQSRAYEETAHEELLRNVVLACADLARQIRLYRAMDTVNAISEERLRILEHSLAAGAASRSDWLSAHVDGNADRAALLRQAAALQSARVLLGQILGRGKAVSEDVDSVALPVQSLDLDALILGLPEHRPELRVSENNLALTEVAAKQRATVWLPKLDALAGYNYSLTNSDAGIVLKNRTIGPSVGLQLNFNLFTGEFPWHAYNRARIAVTSAELRRKDVTSLAESEVQQDYAAFQAADSAATLERQGLGYAQENLGLTFSRWKSGSLSYVDARRAQDQYLDAFTRAENAAFEALRARLDLLRSAGRLETLIQK